MRGEKSKIRKFKNKDHPNGDISKVFEKKYIKLKKNYSIKY
jgi:hypothetical protein